MYSMPWKKGPFEIITSYIFHFHASKLSPLDWLLPIYFNSMKTNRPILSMNSYVFQFYANGYFHPNQILFQCIPIPCKEIGPSESNTSLYSNSKRTNKSIPSKNFFAFLFNVSKLADFTITSYVLQSHVKKNKKDLFK